MKIEDKKISLRLMSGLTAMILAGGSYLALKPSNAYATGSKIVTSKPTTKYREWAGHKIGQFYDEETDTMYNTIEVIENDNASRLSEAIIAVYNKEKQIPKADLEAFDEVNTKTSRSSFWPAVVFYNIDNGQKFHINPGDILIFPETYEEFKEFNTTIKKSRQYANYMASQHIYPEKITVKIDPKEAIRVINEILRVRYPDRVINVDYDYAKAFFDAKSGENLKFVLKNGAKRTKEDDFWIKQDIPSDEIVQEKLNNNNNPKKKTKKR